MECYYRSEPGVRGYRKRMHDLWIAKDLFVVTEQRIVDQANQIRKKKWLSDLELQSQPKVVGTLELDHVSPIPPNQCWKISRFFQQKGKKSPDYQHCKWGEGRTCLVSQLFCPGLSEKKI